MLLQRIGSASGTWGAAPEQPGVEQGLGGAFGDDGGTLWIHGDGAGLAAEKKCCHMGGSPAWRRLARALVQGMVNRPSGVSWKPSFASRTRASGESDAVGRLGSLVASSGGDSIQRARRRARTGGGARQVLEVGARPAEGRLLGRPAREPRYRCDIQRRGSACMRSLGQGRSRVPPTSAFGPSTPLDASMLARLGDKRRLVLVEMITAAHLQWRLGSIHLAKGHHSLPHKLGLLEAGGQKHRALCRCGTSGFIANTVQFRRRNRAR